MPGSACPHDDAEERRRPVYQQLVASGFPDGFAVDDFAGLHFEGTALKEVITEVDGHDAYRLELAAGELRETRIPGRLLS